MKRGFSAEDWAALEHLKDDVAQRIKNRFPGLGKTELLSQIAEECEISLSTIKKWYGMDKSGIDAFPQERNIRKVLNFLKKEESISGGNRNEATQDFYYSTFDNYKKYIVNRDEYQEQFISKHDYFNSINNVRPKEIKGSQELYHITKAIALADRRFNDLVSELLKPMFSTFSISKNNLFEFITKTRDGDGIEYGFKIFNSKAQFIQPQDVEALLRYLNSFFKSGLNIPCLYIIGDFLIKDELEIKPIQSKLSELVQSGRIEEGAIWDVQDLVVYINGIMESEIRDKVEASNKDFLSRYTKILEFESYFPDVPFRFDNSNESFLNPVHFIASKIGKIDRHEYFLQTLKLRNSQDTELDNSDKGDVFMVVSEFGFGKTSLFQNLRFAINSEIGAEPIFLPISQFPEKTITEQNSFVKQVASIIFNQDIDPTNYLDRIIVHQLSKILIHRKDWVLLIDGLDEHQKVYSSSELKNILSILLKMGTGIFISVRKEFFDDKISSFKEIVVSNGRYQGQISLVEWGKEEILEYLDAVSGNFRHSEPNIKAIISRINKLKRVVAEDNYEEYYGDIPKRPLFLAMITRDVISNKVQKLTIYDLYKNYFREKFLRDRSGVFADNVSFRRLSLDNVEDDEKIMGILITILEEIAIRLISVKGTSHVVLGNFIQEHELQKVDVFRDNKLWVSDVLLNSVLVPARTRDAFAGFDLQFGHRSFQEFFTALGLYRALKRGEYYPNGMEGNIFSYEFPSGVSLFLKYEIAENGLPAVDLEKLGFDKFAQQSIYHQCIKRN